MTRGLLWIGLGMVVATALAVRTTAQSAYDWHLPAGFSPPAVPTDNPITGAEVELGRHLFYDTRLSGDGRQSCGTCHEQARAFTDGRPRSVGSTGQQHPRGSMSLVNVGYAQALTWANPALTRLEDQALVPMYGDHPIELGLSRSGQWLGSLERDDTYQRLFPAAFAGSEPFTQAHVVKAIANFERSIVSARSPYDRYHFDRDDAAISDAAKRGEILFHSRPLSCFQCHGGSYFSSAMAGERRTTPVEMHNTGLYNLEGLLSYPADNPGLFEITRDPRDVGRFKPPTLRNIALTSPYMHDGSIVTLEEAIDHYAAGGRTIAAGPNKGVGHDNPNKSAAIGGFQLTAAQRADLVAFLESLTDDALGRDPRFANPWTPSSEGTGR